uniref:Cathepsin L.1 n=1 Tax=Oreochromis niloticus TaxID=8128 RepID=I3J686_ORENI
NKLLILLLVVAAVLAVSSCASISLEDLEFHAWKLKIEKSYASPSEKAQRKQIWLNNRKLVLIHNALADQGLKSYCLGMTQFADMENQEYKKLISQGCLGSFNDSLPRRGSTFNRLPKGTVLPKTDQQQCGSCWAFSATGALEGQHFKKTGKLVPLSEQQLVDCSCKFRNNGCNGDLMNWAFQYIRDNGGVDTEKSYRYEAKDGQCRYRSNSIGAKCNGYVDVSLFEEALKETVATIGPISVATDISHKSLQLYESGVYDEHRCSNIHLNHAVLAVGYGTENGHDYWLEKKTSTCLHWGDKGYIKMTRNKDNQCGIATAASYTLV